MQANYVKYSSPQFRLLSDKQIEELHFATLQILERTGVAFECQEAIDILGEAGLDISDHNRVKIPSYMVEQALRTAPKLITLYSREGEPAIVLNGQTGSHFGAQPGGFEILDPYTKKSRECYVEDIADMARVIDFLPNVEWAYAGTGFPSLPGVIADKVALLQLILNTTKPVACGVTDGSSLKDILELCSIIVGGEEQLRKKPFFIGASEPVSPLVQEKGAMEISLLCAEKGIPNFIYGMPIAGATTPATFAGTLAIASAEVLSQIVVLQLKYPGAPVIFGSLPSVMDMKTLIFPFGAPEMSLMVGALTELSHYYKLPMFGTAGCTDASLIGTQAGVEITYQLLTTALTGADLVHDIGLTYHDRMVSPELMVLADEVIGMVRVLMGGVEINDDTLPLDLIEQLGPRAYYLSERHTLRHFRKFWVPKVFDRSFIKQEDTKDCEELLNQKTIEILETHRTKSLPEDVIQELRKMEKTWFEREGLRYEYPRRLGS